MRDFTPPVAPSLRQRIAELVLTILERAPKVKSQYGRDLAMDQVDMLVSRSAKIDLGEDIGSISLAQSEASARPPFEWIVEVTSEIGESDYLRHYLIRENDMVLAHRKVLTEVDDREAEGLISDLTMTLATL
jgi:hypothetical protein